MLQLLKQAVCITTMKLTTKVCIALQLLYSYTDWPYGVVLPSYRLYQRRTDTTCIKFSPLAGLISNDVNSSTEAYRKTAAANQLFLGKASRATRHIFSGFYYNNHIAYESNYPSNLPN